MCVDLLGFHTNFASTLAGYRGRVYSALGGTSRAARTIAGRIPILSAAYKGKASAGARGRASSPGTTWVKGHSGFTSCGGGRNFTRTGIRSAATQRADRSARQNSGTAWAWRFSFHRSSHFNVEQIQPFPQQYHISALGSCSLQLWKRDCRHRYPESQKAQKEEARVVFGSCPWTHSGWSPVSLSGL